MINDIELQKHRKANANGFKFFSAQHNGYLFVKVVGRWLYKRVLSWDGEIVRSYKPQKLNADLLSVYQKGS